MSYELFVGPEVDYWKPVALLDIVTQTRVIEGKWNGDVLTIDKPDSVILGARSLESVEFNLRARLRETEPFSDVIINVEDSTEEGGIACVPQDITFNGKPVRQGDHIRVTRTFPCVTELTLINDQDLGAVPDSKPALATQVGGSHYKDMLIQPAEYCHKNGIGKLEGDVIAYVSRWRKKNGIEDLKKARHTIDIIIELEGGETHHG